jgi:hypothetical protein
MGRIDTMANRLPQLYRDGELIRGSVSGRTGGVLGVPAVQMEIVDEDGRDIQVAHWFDTARHLNEAAALAQLLDFVLDPWQTLPLFRAWVHAMRSAMLTEGAVTVAGIQVFVEEYTRRFQAATQIGAVTRLGQWSETPSTSLPAFIENPARRLYERVPGSGGTEPLYQFEIVNQGLDETHAAFLLTGLADGPEYVPLIANMTSGQALVFLAPVPPGARLWITPTDDSGVRAMLESTDMSDKLYSVTSLTPGVPWGNSAVQRPGRAITLKRGANSLWFFPLAHYDALGLDRFLLSLPDLLLQQGRYDGSSFDHTLFYQEPALIVRVSWVETQPARFEVALPAGALLSPRDHLDRALEDRDTLERSLNDGVNKLRACGVVSRVALQPFAEFQRQMDFLRAVLPMTHRENGPTGADRLPDAGGIFEVTSYEESTYR